MTQLSKPIETLAAATAAGLGGFVATSVLYPLDTLKTRMQSGAKAFSSDADKPSGDQKLALLRSLYKGIQYKTAESMVSKFFYFYAYTFLSQLIAPKDGSPIGTATNLAVGYVSEFVHLPLTLPMEVIATQLQTGAKGSGNILQIVRNVLAESGVAGFYKGFTAYFVLCLQPAIQYTVFEKVKALYLQRFKQAAQTLGALEAFVLGAIARSVATLLLFPYIRAKVLVQTKKKQAVAGQAASQDGIISTLQRVYKEEGALSLYRGLGPELTKARCSLTGALSSAFMLMVKEKIQTYVTLMLVLANAKK